MSVHAIRGLNMIQTTGSLEVYSWQSCRYNHRVHGTSGMRVPYAADVSEPVVVGKDFGGESNAIQSQRRDTSSSSVRLSVHYINACRGLVEHANNKLCSLKYLLVRNLTGIRGILHSADFPPGPRTFNQLGSPYGAM